MLYNRREFIGLMSGPTGGRSRRDEGSGRCPASPIIRNRLAYDHGPSGPRVEPFMPKPLAPGEFLRGRYRIRSIIGQGGMGAIYLAEDERLTGRLCALKEVVHDTALSAQLYLA